MSRSLSFQAACIRHVLPSSDSEDISSGLSGAIRTIEWVEKNADLIKEFVRMVKEAPIILEVLKEFPGATFTVRDVDARTIPPNSPGTISWRPDDPDGSGQVLEGADDGE